MILTIEISDNAKGVKVTFLRDGRKDYCNNQRYLPGYWNGINGGTHFSQYFDMEDINRVNEMAEVVAVLKNNGIRYYLSKMKRNYRVMISKYDYYHMDKATEQQISDINDQYYMR